MGIGDAEAQPLTPEKAALEMAAEGRDRFCFPNAGTDRPAVVNARRVGGIAVDDAATAPSPPAARRW